MEKQGIRLFNTLKWVSLPGDTIVKGYEGNHLPQLGATDLFTQEAKITAAEPQVPAVKHARIPCTRHRGWCGWQWMAQLAIKRLMDCCYHALQKNKHISEPFEISNNGKEMKTSEDHIHVPYTRWAPPRVYVTTSFFIPCLGKQSEPKLQAKVRRSKNLTSALQKLRIGSVLNVLGLGSPLGGCGPLSKRIWSGHILAKALSNFSDCQAPLNRQQTLRKTYCIENVQPPLAETLLCFRNILEMLWKCFKAEVLRLAARRRLQGLCLPATQLRPGARFIWISALNQMVFACVVMHDVWKLGKGSQIILDQFILWMCLKDIRT